MIYTIENPDKPHDILSIFDGNIITINNSINEKFQLIRNDLSDKEYAKIEIISSYLKDKNIRSFEYYINPSISFNGIDY